MASTQETTLRDGEETRAVLLERARDKIKDRGLARVAVLGPPGSSGEKLALELGFKEIDHHHDYADVLAASAEPEVASLLPVSTVDQEAIHHDASGRVSNLQACLKAGRASIASLQNTFDEPPTITKLLIAG